MRLAEIGTLPMGPGVYFFREEGGALLYVGKAKNLRRRVGSYFRESASHGARTRALVRRIRDIEVVELNTESEALLEEAKLIKRHRPPFNIRLRDDKTYPYLRVSSQGKRPGAALVYRREPDGAHYFGPCLRTCETRAALDALRRLYVMDARAFEDNASNSLRTRKRTRRMARELAEWLSGGEGGARAVLLREIARAGKREDYRRAARLQETLRHLGALRHSPGEGARGTSDSEVSS